MESLSCRIQWKRERNMFHCSISRERLSIWSSSRKWWMGKLNMTSCSFSLSRALYNDQTKLIPHPYKNILRWDLAYLKFCCKVQGIRNELFANDVCKVGVYLVRTSDKPEWCIENFSFGFSPCCIIPDFLVLKMLKFMTFCQCPLNSQVGFRQMS